MKRYRRKREEEEEEKEEEKKHLWTGVEIFVRSASNSDRRILRVVRMNGRRNDETSQNCWNTRLEMKSTVVAHPCIPTVEGGGGIREGQRSRDKENDQ